MIIQHKVLPTISKKLEQGNKSHALTRTNLSEGVIHRQAHLIMKLLHGSYLEILSYYLLHKNYYKAVKLTWQNELQPDKSNPYPTYFCSCR